MLTEIQNGIKKMSLKPKLQNQHIDWLSPKHVTTGNPAQLNDFMAPPQLQQQSPQQQSISSMGTNILTSPINTMGFQATMPSPRTTRSPMKPPNFNFNVTPSRSRNQQKPSESQKYDQSINQQETTESQQFYQQQQLK